jgi:hypothetical protein
MRRLLLIGALALLAGCGGEEQTGTSVASPLAPRSALAVVEIDGDLDSAQWEAARTLIGRFPDGDRFLGKVEDYAVGDRVVVVVLGEDFVALSRADDLLAEKDYARREVQGWTAVAKSEAILDRYEQALAGGTLEGDETYEAALGKLPDEALATAFLNGSALTGQFAERLPGFGGKVEWMAAALTAEERGVRLAGTARMKESTEARALSSELLDRVPGDALAVLAFGGGDGFADQLGGLDALGLDLEPIGELLQDGGVLWVQPGLPIPRVTLVLESGDAGTVDEVVRTFAGDMPIEDAELDGEPARRINLGPAAITWAEIDGRVVLTTGTSLGATGETLADDAAFQDAREAAGMPDETTGFLYVNLQQVVPLVEGFFGLAGEGLGPEVSRNLRPLASLLAFATADGDETRFELFLEID